MGLSTPSGIKDSESDHDHDCAQGRACATGEKPHNAASIGNQINSFISSRKDSFDANDGSNASNLNAGAAQLTQPNKLRSITPKAVEPSRSPLACEESEIPFYLPMAEELLASGGDERIVCDPISGLNRYGCLPRPDRSTLAFGSSTASSITEEAFVAVERLRLRILRAVRTAPPEVVYANELERIRSELMGLCGLTAHQKVSIIFAASGTDVHLVGAQLVKGLSDKTPLIIMSDPAETGSGVPTALAGKHFSNCTALGQTIQSGTALSENSLTEVASIASRKTDGSLRLTADVDAEVESIAVKAATSGRPVLINLVDVSKTGLIIPSLQCALQLRKSFPGAVEVLVDACQYRLATSTLRGYLKCDFWIALTGSKFVGGPPFSGALLLPNDAANRLRARNVPASIKAYSACADWPDHWRPQPALSHAANFGLLLRWEAALTELRRFRMLPESSISDFLGGFASRIRSHFLSDYRFHAAPVRAIDRSAIIRNSAWDQFATIFPFFLRGRQTPCRHEGLLNAKETASIYKSLGQHDRNVVAIASIETTRLQAPKRSVLGQPVPIGVRGGQSISALRLCVSAPLVVDALSACGRGTEAVMRDALRILDNAALQAESFC